MGRCITQKESDLLFEIDQSDFELTEDELDFISNSVLRFHEFGLNMFFSERQSDWLYKIHDKYTAINGNVVVKNMPKLKTWEDMKDS